MKKISRIFSSIIFLFTLGVSFLPSLSWAALSELTVSKSEKDNLITFDIMMPSGSANAELTSLYAELPEAGYRSGDQLPISTYSRRTITTSFGRSKVVTYQHYYRFSLNRTDLKGTERLSGDYRWVITASQGSNSVTRDGGVTTFIFQDKVPPELDILNKSGNEVSDLGTLVYPATPEQLLEIRVKDDNDPKPVISGTVQGSDGVRWDITFKPSGENSYTVTGFSFIAHGVEYTAVIQAVDASGNRSEKNFRFSVLRDEDPPVITFFNMDNQKISHLGTVAYPANPAELFYFTVADDKDEHPQITASFSETGGEKINGELSCGLKTKNSCNLLLKDDVLRSIRGTVKLRIDVKAQDNFGNQSSAVLFVTYQGRSIPPVIEVYDPQGQVLSDSRLLVPYGTDLQEGYYIQAVSPEDGSTDIQVKAVLEGSDAPLSCQEGRCRFTTGICLDNSSSYNRFFSLEINARDKYGDTSSRIVTLSCDNPPPPRIEIYRRDNATSGLELLTAVDPGNSADQIATVSFGTVSWPLTLQKALGFKVVPPGNDQPFITLTLNGSKTDYECNSQGLCNVAVPQDLADGEDHKLLIEAFSLGEKKSSVIIIFRCDCSDLPPELSFQDRSGNEISSDLTLVDPQIPADEIFLMAGDDRDKEVDLTVTLYGPQCQSGCNGKVELKKILSSGERLYRLALPFQDYQQGQIYTLDAAVADSSQHKVRKKVSFKYFKDHTPPRISFCPEEKDFTDEEEISSAGAVRFSVKDDKSLAPKISARLLDTFTGGEEFLSVISTSEGCFGLSPGRDICFRSEDSCYIELGAEDDYGNKVVHKLVIAGDKQVIELGSLSLPFMEHAAGDGVSGHTFFLTQALSRLNTELPQGTAIYAYLQSGSGLKINNQDLSGEQLTLLGEVSREDRDIYHDLPRNDNNERISGGSDRANINQSPVFFLDIAANDKTVLQEQYTVILVPGNNAPRLRLNVSFYTPELTLEGPGEFPLLLEEASYQGQVNDGSCTLTADYSQALQTSLEKPVCLIRFLSLPPLFTQDSTGVKGRFHEEGDVTIKAGLYWVDHKGEELLGVFEKNIKVSGLSRNIFYLRTPDEKLYARGGTYDFLLEGGENICELTNSPEEARLQNFQTGKSFCLIRWKSLPGDFSYSLNQNSAGITGEFLRAGTHEFSWEVTAFTGEEKEVVIGNGVTKLEVLPLPHPRLEFIPSSLLEKEGNCQAVIPEEASSFTDSSFGSSSGTESSSFCHLFVHLDPDRKNALLGTVRISSPASNVHFFHEGKWDEVELKNGVYEQAVYQDLSQAGLYDVGHHIFQVRNPDSYEIVSKDQSSGNNNNELPEIISHLDLTVVFVPVSGLKAYLEIPSENIYGDRIIAEVAVDRSVRGGYNPLVYGRWEGELFYRSKQRSGQTRENPHKALTENEDQIVPEGDVKTENQKSLSNNNDSANEYVSEPESESEKSGTFISDSIESEFREISAGSKIVLDENGRGTVAVDFSRLTVDPALDEEGEFYFRAYLQSPVSLPGRTLVSQPVAVKFIRPYADGVTLKSNRIKGFAPLSVLLSLSFSSGDSRHNISSIKWQIRKCENSDRECSAAGEENSNVSFGLWSDVEQSGLKFMLSHRFDFGVYQIRALLYDDKGALQSSAGPVLVKSYRTAKIASPGPQTVCTGESAWFYPAASFNYAVSSFQREEKIDSNSSPGEQQTPEELVLEESYDQGRTWTLSSGKGAELTSSEPGIKSIWFRAYDPLASAHPQDAAVIRKNVVQFRRPSTPKVQITGPAYIEPGKDALISAKVTGNCLGEVKGFFTTADSTSSLVWGSVLTYQPSPVSIEKGETGICYEARSSAGGSSGKICRRFKVHAYHLPEFSLKIKPHLSYAPEKIQMEAQPKLYTLNALREKSPLLFIWKVTRDSQELIADCIPESSSCIFEADKPGEYQVQLVIADGEGRSREVNALLAMEEPPSRELRINAQYALTRFRAPLNTRIFARMSGGHPREKIREISYFVNGESLPSDSGVARAFLNEGPQILTAHAITTLGNNVFDELVLNVPANQPPVCELRQEENALNYLYRAQCRDPDGRITSYIWHIDGEISHINAWQLAVLKSTRKNNEPPAVTLQAMDDSGGLSTPVVSSPLKE